MKKDRERKLPIFGVGPVYVISCLILTICGLSLDYYGLLESGEVPKAKILLSIIGIIFIICGITLWIKAVLFQRIRDEIKAGHLVTDGVYSIVRNPIYSAFSFIFTGFLLFASNLYLLIIPFIFWAYLSTLMKFTEEKWMKEKFGEKYATYCKKVNRIIPWVRRNPSKIFVGGKKKKNI